MPLEEKTLVFTMCLQRQGRTSSKTSLFSLFSSECVEHTVFGMFFQQLALNLMYRKYHGFLHFCTSSSQSKLAKNTGNYSVLTRPHAKKQDVLKQFFTIFQLVLLHSKNDHCVLYFCHRSSGLKKVLNRNKLLNCT